MKKKIATLCALFAIAPLLTQCASQRDVNGLDYQLRIVNKKLEDMKMGTVGQMQKRQAASSSQIDDLKQEILVLRGQIDEMAHYNRQLKEQNKEIDLSFQQFSNTLNKEIEKEKAELIAKNQAIEVKLDTLENKLARQQEILDSIQQARLHEAKLKAESAARAAEQARQRAKASSTVLESNKNSNILTINADKNKIVHSETRKVEKNVSKNSTPAFTQKEQQMPSSTGIAQADKEFTNKNYKNAYKLYEKFVQSNPKGEQNIEALFKMGECLFYQDEYDQAILQYQKIISNFPQHPRAATALFKQGMAFEKLSDFETAKIIYKKITTTYSSSPEAARATERSGKLK